MEEKNLVPQEELQENAQKELEPQNVEKESAGPFGLIVSALFPIIGVIIYFSQKNEVRNPGAYLIAALCGFVLGLILRAIAI